MTGKDKLFLAILVVLPFFIPLESRCGIMSPFTSNPNAEMDIATVLYLWCTVLFPFYWCFVGVMFARRVYNLSRALILANIPVWMNVIGALIYFVFLKVPSGAYPWIEYIIGSHLDKANFFVLFDMEYLPGSLLFSLGVVLVCFLLGYGLRRSWELLSKGRIPVS